MGRDSERGERVGGGRTRGDALGREEVGGERAEEV